MRVQTGCRDCALCTGNTFTGFGRVWGRAAADVSTLGLTNLTRKKCKGCGHPMSEHQPVQAQVQPVFMGPQQVGVPAGWYADPTDARMVCWWDGFRWRPETKRQR